MADLPVSKAGEKMIRKKYHRLTLLLIVLLQFCLSPLSAFADELVEDVTVHTEANGDAVAILRFAFPIQYLRHFPVHTATETSIYFNILGGVPAEAGQEYESHRTPPSDVIKDITISTLDRATGPKIIVTAFRPAEFAVTMGSNNQILLIRVRPVKPPQKKESRVEESSKDVTPPPAMIPPAPMPPVEKAIPVPAAPEVSPPSAEAPVAPSGEITQPPVVLAPSSSKPIRIPLGGKDGLPVFPAIDQAPQKVKPVPGENVALAEQIAKANNQAAIQMTKGGNALLAGQPFIAVEAFNNVLNLPPNKYSQDAQLWIGIARERSGQLPKAILEFQSYLRLYPEGREVKWVRARLDALKASQPALFVAAPTPVVTPMRAQNTEFRYSEFGSLSTYYYTGRSRTNTTTTVGATQTPASFSRIDQRSLITNVNMVLHGYNNEYDNRVVFQDFYAANYLPGQQNNNRLGAAYYEMRDRILDYSFRVGRQSGFGGGVMGRFDGISAGYGFAQNWQANVVAGRLSDYTIDAKPRFEGVSLDFGVRDPLGGSVYFINQTVSGFTDRRATGGNLRYSDSRFALIATLDYDVQFKAVNIMTVQGTVNGGGVDNDYNFLLDRRRSPILDIRNAVSGTTTSLATLTQNGWTTNDLLLLANQRTTTSNTAQVGMTHHLNEKWNIGTDFIVSETEGLAASGGVIDPVFGCIATEGCVSAQPSTGNTWTISERMTGTGVIRPRDITNFIVSYSKGKLNQTEAFQFSNHADLADKWTLDSTFHLGHQTDNTGGKSDDFAPTERLSYQIRNNLALDTQLGLDWTKSSANIVSSSGVFQSSSSSFREFFSLGFRLNF